MSQPAPASRKKKTAAIVSSVAIAALILLCLGAVATPKFGGFGNKCKFKQTEAKVSLSGLFTAEKRFFDEHGYYTTDLVALGWQPDGAPAYVVGFASPSAAKSDPALPELDPGRRTTLDPRVAGAGSYRPEKMRTLTDRVLGDEDFLRAAPTSTATSNGFLAFAIGDVGTDAAEDLDVWVIDQDKAMQSIHDDCSN